MTKHLLKEGGLYGHMAHLYERTDDLPYGLTFAQIKDIFTKAAQGELIGTEKTDGQNLFVSYSVKSGKAKAARNLGQIRTGGIDIAQLADFFTDHPNPNLKKAFVEAFSTFEKGIKSLLTGDQEKLFGMDADVYYNAEVQDPRTANIINYDKKTLNIHHVGHVRVNKLTGELQKFESEQYAIFLERILKKVQQTTMEDEYSVVKNAVITLRGLSDGKPLEQAIARLEKEISSVGISDNEDVADYLVAKITPYIESRIEIPRENVTMLLKRIMGVKKEVTKDGQKKMVNYAKREITQGLTFQEKKQIDELVADAKFIVKKALLPIEDIVHDFSVEMLRGLESAFILDNRKAVEKLRIKVSKAIELINATNDEKMIKVLKDQLRKLKSLDDVSTAAEGFVFDYEVDGKNYTFKFTGNFAPINQILGMLKYGDRIKGVDIDRVMSDKTEDEIRKDNFKSLPGKKIGLLPGKFKPPHAGHFGIVNEAINDMDLDEVLIIISKREHEGIVAAKAKQVWDIFLNSEKADPEVKAKVKAIVADESPSPVGYVYDYIDKTVEPNVNIALLLGDKDIADGRYAGLNAQRDSVRGKNLSIFILPISPQAGGINATSMRDFWRANEKTLFFTGLPKHLSDIEREETWRILKTHPTVQELTEMIESMVEHVLDEQTEPIQKAWRKKHPRMKKRLVGKGGNKHTGGGRGHTRPKMKRTMSAPPLGEDQSEEVVELDADKLGAYISGLDPDDNKNRDRAQYELINLGRELEPVVVAIDQDPWPPLITSNLVVPVPNNTLKFTDYVNKRIDLAKASLALVKAEMPKMLWPTASKYLVSLSLALRDRLYDQERRQEVEPADIEPFPGYVTPEELGVDPLADTMTEAELEETSTMGAAGGGAIEFGGAPGKRDKKKKKRPTIFREEELVDEIMNYLIKIGAS